MAQEDSLSPRRKTGEGNATAKGEGEENQPRAGCLWTVVLICPVTAWESQVKLMRKKRSCKKIKKGQDKKDP